VVVGNLSEKEVKELVSLLESGNIAHEVKIDQSVIDSNDYSLQNNLRYLSPPSLSSDILCVEIADEHLENISQELKQKLEKYVFLGEPPGELDLSQKDELHQKVNKVIDDGKIRMLGSKQLHQIIIVLICLALYLVLKII